MPQTFSLLPVFRPVLSKGASKAKIVWQCCYKFWLCKFFFVTYSSKIFCSKFFVQNFFPKIFFQLFFKICFLRALLSMLSRLQRQNGLYVSVLWKIWYTGQYSIPITAYKFPVPTKFCLDPLTSSKVIVSTWKVHVRTCIQTDRQTEICSCLFCLLKHTNHQRLSKGENFFFSLMRLQFFLFLHTQYVTRT